MQRAANEAPASGPTITTAQALARHPATGRFIETDGCGRSDAERRVIAARRADVATLYPAKTPDVIGPELGWSPATIDKDVAWLVEADSLNGNGRARRGSIRTPRSAPARAAAVSSHLRTGRPTNSFMTSNALGLTRPPSASARPPAS
jgi:hypothetical protein